AALERPGSRQLERLAGMHRGESGEVGPADGLLGGQPADPGDEGESWGLAAARRAGLALDVIAGTQLVSMDDRLGNEDVLGARQVAGAALAQESAAAFGQFEDAADDRTGARFPRRWWLAQCRRSV